MPPEDMPQAINQLVALLAAHRANPWAVWVLLPLAFEVVMGRAVDRADDHDLMICNAVAFL